MKDKAVMMSALWFLAILLCGSRLGVLRSMVSSLFLTL